MARLRRSSPPRASDGAGPREPSTGEPSDLARRTRLHAASPTRGAAANDPVTLGEVPEDDAFDTAERVIAEPEGRSGAMRRATGAAPKRAAPRAEQPGKGADKPRRSRSLRMTREGKWFVGITLGVGFAAVNTGNNLIYLMLGLMLSLIIVSGVLSELTLRRVKVRRQLPVRAFAGAETLVEIVLTNEKRFVPSLSLEVEDVAKGVVTERRCYFLKVAPGGTQIAAYRRKPRGRGLLVLSAFRLATRYPFGLFEKSRHVESSSELLFYPALVKVAPVAVRGVVIDDDGHDPMAGQGTGIAGLREHRDGDDAHDVHWPKSASIGRLVVRDRERDTRSKVALRLDNAEPAGLDELARAHWLEGFEHAISQTASLAALLLRRGTAVVVVTRGAASPALGAGSAPDPIWRFLALLEPVDATIAAPMTRAQAQQIDVPVVAGSRRDPAAADASVARPSSSGARKASQPEAPS